MRELSFAEVRAAGLRAYVEFAYVGYEYRPLYDDRPLLGRGDRRLRAGGHFLQVLEKGCEIRRTPFLGSLGSVTHWWDLLV